MTDKKKKMALIPWSLLALSITLIILSSLGSTTSIGLMFLLGFIGMLIYGIAGVWLIISYRTFFQKWRGWLIIMLSACFSVYALDNPIQYTFTPLALLLLTHMLWSFVFVNVSTWIFLWKNDASVPICAAFSIALMWLFALSFGLEPNLITKLFLSFQPSTTVHPLWAANPIMLSMLIIMPISIITFFRHTFCYLKREFGGQITPTSTQ